eukprot:SAG22_NODE_9548_length_583_cov_3.065982_1_plen_29_part_10
MLLCCCFCRVFPNSGQPEAFARGKRGDLF